MSVVCAYAIA